MTVLNALIEMYWSQVLWAIYTAAWKHTHTHRTHRENRQPLLYLNVLHFMTLTLSCSHWCHIKNVVCTVTRVTGWPWWLDRPFYNQRIRGSMVLRPIVKVSLSKTLTSYQPRAAALKCMHSCMFDWKDVRKKNSGYIHTSGCVKYAQRVLWIINEC